LFGGARINAGTVDADIGLALLHVTNFLIGFNGFCEESSFDRHSPCSSFYYIYGLINLISNP
jgi:hypothetical protein